MPKKDVWLDRQSLFHHPPMMIRHFERSRFWAALGLEPGTSDEDPHRASNLSHYAKGGRYITTDIAPSYLNPSSARLR